MKKIVCTVLSALTVMTLAVLPTGAMSPAVCAASEKLAAPADLKVESRIGAAVLSWDAVKGADKYRIYRWDDSRDKWQRYGTVRGTRAVIKGLEGGVGYTYRVAAIKGRAEGETSVPAEVMCRIKAKTYIDGYRSIVKKASVEGTDPMCSLYDITGDDIPELFVSPCDTHASGVDVYTWANGAVIPVRHAGGYGFGSGGEVVYLPSSGLLDSYYIGMGVIMNELFRVKDNGTAERVFFSENGEYIGGGNDPYHIINDKKVSKKSYDKAVKKYVDAPLFLGRSYVIDPDKHPDIYKKNGYVCIEDIFRSLENGEEPELSVAHESEWVSSGDLFQFDD